ncbi:hypothetical protein [Holophaga foetida]|uniref:hypothetical protein n=1 Tax=Holophaga foetida TaxID=35839 RepID=UPI000247376C|nr:hypothetical protein [Holophaga foetida]
MSASARKSFWRYENFIVIAMFLGYGVIMMDRLTLAFLFPFALKETAPRKLEKMGMVNEFLDDAVPVAE